MYAKCDFELMFQISTTAVLAGLVRRTGRVFSFAFQLNCRGEGTTSLGYFMKPLMGLKTQRYKKVIVSKVIEVNEFCLKTLKFCMKYGSK